MKKNIKVSTALLLTLALTGSLLAGCSSGSKTATGNSDKPITLIYWTQNAEPYVKVAKDLAAKFHAKNPNISIKVESFPTYAVKANTALSTNTAPDVLELYGSTVSLAKGGKILPVPDSVMTKAIADKTFYPQALANRLYNGKYYGLPNEINMESPGLLINLDLVKKAGLTIPDEWIKNNGPRTWTELVEFAKKLIVIKSGTMKQAGLGVIGGQSESMFLSLIWQFGGDYRDQKNNKVNFDTPEAKKAVEFMKGLLIGPNQVETKGSDSRFDGFKGGTNAMTIGAPWYASELDSNVKGLKYQYFNLPPFVDGAKPNFVGEGGWGYLVTKQGKNPDAAWKFVKFMLQKENQDVWAQAVGSVSSRKDSPVAFTYDPLIGSTNKALSISQNITKYGNDPGAYTMDTVQLIWTMVRQNLKAMLQGEVTVDAGLKQLDKQANDMIQRNLAR